MNPRDGDMLTVEEPPQLIIVYPRRRILPVLALAGMLATFVLGFLFHAAVTSAAPRTAPSDSGPWTLLEAPHAAMAPARPTAELASPPVGLRFDPGRGVSLPPSPTTGTRPASVEAPPDLRTPPASSISGTATWYDDGPGYYAAVPTYRWGDPRYKVTVCNRDGACVVVTVRDFCGCPGDRIIDLSPAAFSRLAPLSRGIVPVTVSRGAGPSVTVPPTDR